jgi:geranylgeranyl diphosphate synthase type II
LELESYLEKTIDKRCESYPEKTLTDAMKYSVLSGGKRLRASLVNVFSDGKAPIEIPAAVEMVQSYSLIHDDLPSMDNDDFRRGKPTLHRAYDEATAILAGDALLTLAFEEIADAPISDKEKTMCTKILASHIGAEGMVGGQQADMYFEGKKATEEELRRLQLGKTGKFIMASCALGAVAGGNEDYISEALEFGRRIGLAFQIKDDILDVTGTLEELGKAPGYDDKNEKTTFVSLFGIKRCEEIIKEELDLALTAISGTPFDREDVKAIAFTIVNRKN